MPDLHGWITQQIDRTEAVARAADGRIDEVLGEYYIREAMEHLDLHAPASVMRRCAADRKILAEHKPLAVTWSDWYACKGCGYDGADYCSEPNVAHTNDCPTLLALAEGYGLTKEQRATLDRPEKEPPPRKPGFGGMSDVVAEQMIRVSLATVPLSLRGPNWKA